MRTSTSDENAVLHSFVSLYRGVRIGSDFFAHAHAVVREFCAIGDRVILPKTASSLEEMVSASPAKPAAAGTRSFSSGPVVIEDDVEVQSNSCVESRDHRETPHPPRRKN